MTDPMPHQHAPAGPVRIGILTVSDRAAAGVYEDRGGPAIRAFLESAIDGPWEPCVRVVPDERDRIAAAIAELVDEAGCSLVLTTGGTGPAPRDVTPEATADACRTLLPGFGELMRAVSLRVVPTAILSRQTAGIRGGALVVNLPGQPSAIADCLDAVLPAIPYGIELAGGPWIATRPGPNRAAAFRPKSAGDPPPHGRRPGDG